MNRRLRERFALLGLLGALVGGGAWLVAEAPANDAEPESADIDGLPVDAAGPRDGLESLLLPVTVEPDSGLADGQHVEVTGSGFSPGVTVAMVQCWLTETGGSRDDCDLGNVGLAYVDEGGIFYGSMSVRRVIDTANAQFDCAQGTAEQGCRIGVANTQDLDESGGASILFAVEGTADMPHISATPTTILADGDPITVTGQGFVPGATVQLTQCPVGGLNDTRDGCFGRNPGIDVLVDGDGSFVVTVAAARLRSSAEGEHDCALDFNDCMLVVSAERAPNPVALQFDASVALPPPPEYTITPNRELVDGQSVRLEVFDIATDGAAPVQQCADGGPRGFFCVVLGSISVAEGTGGADLAVTRILTNDDGDTIDCTEPARICYLDVAGPFIDLIRGPLHFADVGQG